MIKLLHLILFTCSVTLLSAQNDVLVYKRGHQKLQYFFKDSYISFQLKDQQWTKGFITGIQNDSFYFTKEIVRYYTMGSDTIRYAGYHYAIGDIYAMPKKGVQIDYIGDQFGIATNGGHQHWYWIKSGWVFRVGAAGYAALDVANGIINHNFSFTGSRLGIAAGVFAAGMILKKTYKLTHRLGKKYHFETMEVAGK
jgi:hypothetical protein